MEHIKIIQNAGVIEEVSNTIISKLYELAEAGLDTQSSVVGRVHVENTYRYMVEALTGQNGYFPDFYISKDNYLAYFEDPEVRRIMQNTYGELLESQLSSITSIGDTFAGTNIKTFRELGQTGVTSIPYNAFDGCSELEHVDVSKIVNIGSSGGANDVQIFNGCAKLKELELTSLKWSYIRTGNTGKGWAWGCSSLKSVNMPELLCNSEWAYNNNAYTSIQISNPFYGCTSLEYINFGKAINLVFAAPDSYHSGSFENMPALKIVECGAHLTSLGRFSFRNTPNLKALVIKNTTTVPTMNWGNDTKSIANMCGGSTDCIIYVPQSMISVYQTDSDWSALSANIQPIENYDKDTILAAS